MNYTDEGHPSQNDENGNTISEKELLHLSDLIFVAESANEAVSECLKAYKEKYGLDGSTLKSFVKSKFGDAEKHSNKLQKHLQFVELNEQFETI